MLKRFLDPVPMRSSLMRGFPILCTWWNVPELCAGSGDRRTVVRGRDVVAQTPIVAAVEVGASMAPVRVNIWIGTSMAMEFTA
jgi:hypothetical protein